MGSFSTALSGLNSASADLSVISNDLANMNTVVMPLVGNRKYPQIAADYERAYQTQRMLSPDIWVAAHAAQYDMAAKVKAGSFVDPQGYKNAVEHYEALFRETLAKEQKAAAQPK